MVGPLQISTYLFSAHCGKDRTSTLLGRHGGRPTTDQYIFVQCALWKRSYIDTTGPTRWSAHYRSVHICSVRIVEKIVHRHYWADTVVGPLQISTYLFSAHCGKDRTSTLLGRHGGRPLQISTYLFSAHCGKDRTSTLLGRHGGRPLQITFVQPGHPNPGKKSGWTPQSPS